MKPLYWKLLLILGAVIVGASLIVPKSLRKNANLSYETPARSEVTPETGSNNDNLLQADITFEFNNVVRTNQAVLAPHESKEFHKLISSYFGKPLATILNSEIITAICGHGIIQAGFTVKEARNVVLRLNAGMRPTKSRVID